MKDYELPCRVARVSRPNSTASVYETVLFSTELVCLLSPSKDSNHAPSASVLNPRRLLYHWSYTGIQFTGTPA